MNGELQLSLLGPLRINVGDGQPFDLPARKEAALLAYLATEHRRAHSRESLVGLLWPDASLDKARLSLRVNLSNLKKHLQPATSGAILVSTPHEIQFLAAACELDLVEFDRCLRSGERHEHRRDELCHRCAPAFSRAAELYRGPFLDGFSLDQCQHFEEWLFMQRERFRAQILEVLEKLTTYHLSRRDLTAALTCARLQLEIDPLREQAHHQIIQIHLAQGDRTGALRQYEQCRAVLAAELGIEPDVELRALRDLILAAPAATNSSPPSPLGAEAVRSEPQFPVYLTPFVGRQAELALLAQRIHSGAYRLITLAGAGGMGKTRLAVEAAQQQSAHFPDGVYFVPCVAVPEAAALFDALAAALGITFRADGRTPTVQVLDWLRPRRALLLIDNFEHLLPAAPRLLELLAAAPQVVLLTTCREPLGVQAEDVVTVTGLPVPEAEQMAAAGDFPAVRLFADRAYRVDKQFHLTPGNVADVVRICRLVAGQPLALELAAAHTATRSCAAIAAAIAADLDFLSAELPDLPARHRSLRAVFEQSWQALTPQEQSCFSRLSVFSDPFSSEAAEAVAGAPPGILWRLSRLHLLNRHNDFERYTVHDLLRSFAASRLAESLPDAAVLHRRHAEHFLTWVSRQEAILAGIQPMRSAETIQASLDDVRAAWLRASAAQAVDLLQRAQPVWGAFYALRGMYSEGERLYTATLAQLGAEAEGLRGQLLARLGSFLERQGRLEAARSRLQEGLAIAQRCQDYQTVGFVCHTLARVEAVAGTVVTAIQFLETGLASLPAGEYLTVRAELLIYLGTLEAQRGNRAATAAAYAEVQRIVARTGNKVQEQRLLLYQGVDTIDDNYVAALFYLKRALALCPDTGDRTLESRILNALGYVQARMGDYAAAIHNHLRGLAICAADQDAIQQSHALHNLCVDYSGLGQYETAYAYGQEALAIAERNNLQDGIGYAQLHLGHVLAKLRLYREAEHALLTARDAFAGLERRLLEIEAEAGLAHIKQLVGDLPAALAHTARVLTFLATQTLTGSDEPVRVYLHCCQVLLACGDPRAQEVLTAAYRYIEQRAALLDPDARARYLTAVAANRQIVELWRAQGA
jgi:DNA-binding SARP family transcriptional activator/predicted ATPase